jgi:hypothetical protein
MMVEINNQRRKYVMRDFVAPMLVATVIGIGSSFFGVRLAVSTLEVDVNNVKGDILKLEHIMEAVQEQGEVLSARGQWMQSTDRRLAALEIATAENHRTVGRILETRYTPEDASKDRQLLVMEIERLLKRTPSN